MHGRVCRSIPHESKIIRLINEKSVANSTVDWSPDGKSIATAGDLMQVTIWDSVSLSFRHQLNHGVRDWGGDNITFSPDSQYLATDLGAVNVWNVADGTLQATLIAPHIISSKRMINFPTGMRVMDMITFLKYLSFSASLAINEFQRSSPKAAIIYGEF